MATEAGLEIGAARAEHQRHVDAAGHRQPDPDRLRHAAAQHQRLAGPHGHAPVGRQRDAIEPGAEIAAGQRDAGVGLEAQFAAAHGQLDAGGAGRVAHQPVGQGQRQRIERAAGTDAELALAMAAQVLDRGQQARLDDDDHDSMRSTTNRTRSPGRSRVGAAACGSNSSIGVRPISCQPPGDASG